MIHERTCTAYMWQNIGWCTSSVPCADWRTQITVRVTGCVQLASAQKLPCMRSPSCLCEEGLTGQEVALQLLILLQQVS